MKRIFELSLLLGAIALTEWAAATQLTWHAPTFLTGGDATRAHPGGPFAIIFADEVPGDIAFELGPIEGPAVALRTRRSEDGRSLAIEPVEALDWGSDYRLCVRGGGGTLLPLWQLIGADCSSFRTMSAPEPTGTSKAPILIAAGPERPFARYFGPILQAEGFTDFASVPLAQLTAEATSERAVIILDGRDVPQPMLAFLTAWVEAGGLLVVMRPGEALRDSLGLAGAPVGVSSRTLLQTDADHPVTRGLPREPLPLHGPIDKLRLSENEHPQAEVLATFAGDDGATFAAMTLQDRGKGQIAAFSFDVARSVVLKRQGNPMWIDEERDGSPPLRPSDLFYPDFVDLDRADVPAADELQRLLANLMIEAAPLPLPRFWYLPGERRAALIMTGDDHWTKHGTLDLFTRLDALSPPDCDLEAWECLRATAYLSPGTVFDPAVAKAFVDQGFEVGVHVDTGCTSPKDRDALRRDVAAQMANFREAHPALPPQKTHRIHCIVWRGWIDVPVVEREHGIRLDLNYYNWPPDWIAGRRVFLTGSGFPMPYADQGGAPIDIYQATSHLVNEDGIPMRHGVELLLDKALGPEQFFGAFGTHYDYTDPYAQVLTEAALERGVPLITSQQMLTWLDARNSARFSGLRWDAGRLSFTTELGEGAAHASGLLPLRFKGKRLKAIECDGDPVALRKDVIKGIEVAFFRAVPGRCAARYESAQS